MLGPSLRIEKKIEYLPWGSHMYFNSIKKKHSNRLFSSKSFEPKNREVIENSSNAPLYFSPLKYTCLDKNSFQNH